MDLSKNFRTKEGGAVLALVNPQTGSTLLDDNREPMTITMEGPDTPRLRKLSHRYSSRRLKQVARMGGQVDENISEGTEEDSLELISEAATGWHVQIGGEHPPFSREAVRKLYEECGWIRRQALAFFNHEGNFLGN